MTRAKKPLFYNLFPERLVVVVLVGLLGLPLSANAGFLSSVLHDILENTSETSSAEGIRSQTLGSLSLLEAAKNIDPNPAKGGGEITIVDGNALLSESGPSGSLAALVDRPRSDQISIYVVREGDSLSGIAKMFGVSSNTIIWANDLSRSGAIKEGQTLIILPISGIKHVVAKGETLQSIAKKYKGDITEILDYNGLSKGAVLAVGETVIIPDGELSAVSSGVSKTTKSSSPDYRGYYIRPIAQGLRSQGIHGYNGVDLAGPPGVAILAAASGDVIISRSSGWNGGYGNYIVISHPNGTQTLYAHLSRDVVSVGEHVAQGQVIGYQGSTGKSTGPHLHFEIRGARNPF